MESSKFFFFSWLRCFILEDGLELNFYPFRIGGNDQTLRNMLNQMNSKGDGSGSPEVCVRSFC